MPSSSLLRGLCGATAADSLGNTQHGYIFTSQTIGSLMPITFKVTTDSLDEPLAERVEVSLEPLHKNLAEQLFSVSQRSFRKEQSPAGEPWAELSPATFELGFRKRYKNNKSKKPYKTVRGQRVPTAAFQRYIDSKRILQEQGTRGGLRALTVQANEDSARIGSAKPQARIQQLGSDGPMKGFIKSELPPRPYVGVSKDDRAAMSRIATRFFRRALEGGDS